MDPSPRRLAGRLALITGATRGIGRAVALAYAREGAHVILAGRTVGALEEVDDEIREIGGAATLLTLDLKRQDKIDALGPTIYRRWQKLDILVGNAGILGPLSPLGHVPAETWDEVLQVNLTANWRLIRTLDPLLRASDAGRAIHFTTSVASAPKAFWGMYAATKAGAEALVKAWADEIESTPVRVSIVDPGRMRTAMRAQAYPGEDPSVLPHPSEIGPLVVDLARPDATPPLTIRFRDWAAGPTTEALV
jgi:NAD(P)-dependent dehydrogenase (short-subunit alcohol dehydrogenase family)